MSGQSIELSGPPGRIGRIPPPGEHTEGVLAAMVVRRLVRRPVVV